MRVLCLGIFFVFTATTQVHAWSAQGHQAIAEAAQASLQEPTALAIARILGTDHLTPHALAEQATWADEIRARSDFGTVAHGWGPDDVKEADTFNRDHKDNAQWHFVNLPVGASGYPNHTTPEGDPLLQFVSPSDVVQIVKQCIERLESPDESATFTKKQALRWLIHLVGDVHQPLHVTTGYYITAQRISGTPS